MCEWKKEMLNRLDEIQIIQKVVKDELSNVELALAKRCESKQKLQKNLKEYVSKLQRSQNSLDECYRTSLEHCKTCLAKETYNNGGDVGV